MHMYRLPMMLIALSGVTACMSAPTQVLDLAIENKTRCSAPAGVTLTDKGLMISAGSKPTPGYAIEVVRQEQQSGSIELDYQVSSPAGGAIMAQVLTSPCGYLSLPDDWQSLSVTNIDSGETWSFSNQ